MGGYEWKEVVSIDRCNADLGTGAKCKGLGRHYHWMLDGVAIDWKPGNLQSSALPDSVNKPAHYTQGAVECIDGIEAAMTGLTGKQGFLTGQVIKYMWRWGHKNGIEDLRKARWYLERLIKLEDESNGK